MSARLVPPMAFDFLWEELGLGEQPYPLRVRSHGETMDERGSLRRRVWAELAQQGVKDGYGALDPALEGSLRLLAANTLSVDAVHIPEFEAHPISALAATDGENGVLAVQDADGIWLRPIFPEALASEIVNLLPTTQRGTERSVTISLDEALRTQPARVKIPSREEPEQRKQDQKSRFGLRRQPAPVAEAPRRPLAERTRGSAKEDYALLIAQPRQRGGQIAANARDEAGRKHRSPVLAWFDTVTGRYLSLSRTGPDGHEWVTVSAADAKTLRTRVSEMLNGVRTQAR